MQTQIQTSTTLKRYATALHLFHPFFSDPHVWLSFFPRVVSRSRFLHCATMAAMVFLLLLLALSGCSDAAWCICRTDMSSTALQKTLDYACGAGADCSPILQNGACYNPNTVINHCSYAANSYYQRKGQVQGACDFSGTAVLTQNDPSLNGCTYPATQSAAATSGGGAGIPAQNPGGSSTATPTSFTPTQGSTGGVLGGLGPSGTTTSIDGNGAGRLPSPKRGLLSLTAFLSGLALCRL